MDWTNAQLPDPQPATPAPTEQERRLHARYTVQVQAELREDGAGFPLRLETTDLSRGGCYVQLLMPLALGACVRVTLWLDGCSVVIRGRVVTRHPQFGNGIMFVEFEGQGEEFLERYLHSVTA